MSEIRIDAAVSFNAVAHRRYVLERSINGVDWTLVPGAEDIPGTGGIVTAYDPGAGCQGLRLYRARLTQ